MFQKNIHNIKQNLSIKSNNSLHFKEQLRIWNAILLFHKDRMRLNKFMYI